MKLNIKNFGHPDGVEVRIIKVSAATTFIDDNAEFQALDIEGIEHGIKLSGGPTPISCDGAIAHAAIINIGGDVMDGPNPFTLEFENEPPVQYSTFNDLADALDRKDFVIFILEDWTPPVVAS